MKPVVFFLLFLSCAFGLSAQQAKQYSFNHYSTTNGLASNAVLRVVQDREGYMWIGTANGLQRYDGNTFMTFRAKTGDANALPANRIELLHIDPKGNLWVMTDNAHIGMFDTHKFVYRDVPIERSRGRLYIAQHFLDLPTGELVLLKSDGIFLQYLPQSNKFVERPDIIPHPEKWKPIWLLWDTGIKKYWLACDSGLVQINPATKAVNYRGHNVENDPVIKAYEKQLRPVCLYNDSADNLLFYHWPDELNHPNLHRFNRRTGKAEITTVPVEGYHEMTYYLRQRNGRLWIYGMPFLAQWAEKNGKSYFVPVRNEYRNEHSLKFDYLNMAFEDRENNIWLATNNGLYHFNPDAQIFNTYYVVRPDGKPAFEAPVQAVEELADGRIFIGCWGGGGVTCYDQQFNPVALPPFPKGEISTWDMAVHPPTGNLWMTLQGGSIVIFDPKKNRFRRIAPDIFNKATIRQVDEDTSGNLWFGTQGGRVIKWDYRKSGGDPEKGYELALQTGRVQKIHFDYQGYIWIATLANGLIKMNAKTYAVEKTFTNDGPPGERLFTNDPGDMTYYNDTTLIVTASCLNVINTKTNKVSYITMEDGLPSNSAQSVEKDENGIVWVGMTNGLCRLNLEKKLITYYDRRDGIIDDEFQMGGVKELNDSRLVFYTNHNFMVFEPGKFGQQYLPPRPHLTAFKLAGQSLLLDSILKDNRAVLKYNNTSVAINFSALSYMQQRKIFYYKLDGLDKDWVRTDEPIEVVYNHLEPGDYTFRLKSGNADGMMNEEEVTLPITVRPPFWKTWWFYSLLALLIITVLYLLDKERMDRIRSMQQMRQQIRSNLADEVSVTLNNITVLSEIAKMKADRNISQAKDFIDQISDKSRHMMQAMDDTLWSIDPQNDSMRQTLLRMRELTEGVRAAEGVDIDLIVDNKVPEIEMDMKLRYEVYFYYKEALEYVVRNMNCSQVFVNINKVRSRLMIEILSECNPPQGAALDTEFAAHVSKRVNAMNGEVDVLLDTKSFSALLYVDIRK